MSEAAADRLERVRGLLRGFENRRLTGPAAAGAQPGAGSLVAGSLAAGVLPVVEPLARLLPAGGLRRGSTVSVLDGPGGSSLLLALLVEVSVAEGWVGVVGRPELGLVAAAEAGIRLDRVALIPRPGGALLEVVAGLLDGLDLVVVGAAATARAADRQRLAARARQRGSVLLVAGPWPGADLELSCTEARWLGLGPGFGRLRCRRVQVRLRGRGLTPAGIEGRLLLPGPTGRIADAVRPAVGFSGTGSAVDRPGDDSTPQPRSPRIQEAG